MVVKAIRYNYHSCKREKGYDVKRDQIFDSERKYELLGIPRNNNSRVSQCKVNFSAKTETGVKKIIRIFEKIGYRVKITQIF